MISFFKFIVFIGINLGATFCFISISRWLLFFPKTEKFIMNRKIPLTPGFLYRKKNWIIKKLSGYLHDYIRDTHITSKKSQITLWEDKIYKATWEKFEFIEEYSLPLFIKKRLHILVSQISYEFSKQFLRNFVPYLIESYNVKSYIPIIEEKLDIETVEKYFVNYFFKWIMYFFLVISFFTGLMNGILFLLLN